MYFHRAVLFLAATVLSVSVANAAEVTDVEAVPYLNDKGRDGYRDFLEWSGSRAFVVSPSGSWSWRGPVFGGTESAITQALQKCTVGSKAPCYTYAVDDKVVWNGPAPNELTELDTTKLGFSMDLPERWKPKCAAKALITDSTYFRACTFVDSKRKASIEMAVRGTAGDIDSWGKEMTALIEYGWKNNISFVFNESASRSEEILLPNGIPAIATHKTYTASGSYNLDASYLTFALKDIYVWMVIYNSTWNCFCEIVGPELEGILSAIKLQ